ncbi:MAG: AAA family ATPase [Thermodesulfobacteriota bacterium]
MEQIEDALRAGIPILYVTSPEEERVVTALEQSSRRLKRKLWLYTVSEGLWTVDFPPSENGPPEPVYGKPNPEFRDPVALLRNIKTTHVPKRGAIYLLLDFHEFLSDPVTRRLLRDLGAVLKAANSAVIILAPVASLPQVLENDVWCRAFPLPTRTELAASLGRYAERNADDGLAGIAADQVRAAVAEAGRGLTLKQFEQSVARAMVRRQGMITAAVADDIARARKDILRRTAALTWIDAEPGLNWGGLSALKQWLAERKRGFSDEARRAGLPAPRGILLLGVPGCGKSLAARMTAAFWNLPLARLETGGLFTSRVGGSEERTRQAISAVEAIAPCVLWIDEIEKAMAGISGSADSDAGTASRVFAALATWMQEKTAPVFVVATANSVAALPPELLRKGRWDEIFFVDLPGLGERREIAEIHLRKAGHDAVQADARLIAEHGEGLSGAEIEQAIVAGRYRAFAAGRSMTGGDVLAAMAGQVPLSVTMAEEISALREWAAVRARPASVDDVQEQRDDWRRRKAGGLVTLPVAGRSTQDNLVMD